PRLTVPGTRCIVAAPVRRRASLTGKATVLKTVGLNRPWGFESLALRQFFIFLARQAARTQKKTWRGGRVGLRRRFAKPLSGLNRVPRVRLPPSPPAYVELTVSRSVRRCEFGMRRSARPSESAHSTRIEPGRPR